MDPRRVAIHEASHAVMAEAVGRRVEEVSIVPVGNLLGYCYSVAADHPPVYRDEIRMKAVNLGYGSGSGNITVPEGIELYNSLWIDLAGMAGERIAFGGSIPDTCSSDIECAVTLIVHGYPAEGAEAVAAYDRALDVTEAKLRPHWDAVERVAGALERRRTLNGVEVRRLISGAEPASETPRVRVRVSPDAVRHLTPRYPLAGRVYA